MSEREKTLFEQFYDAFKKANQDALKKDTRRKGINLWNKIKEDSKSDQNVLQNAVADKIREFRNKEIQKKAKNSQIFEKFRKSQPKTSDVNAATQKEPSLEQKEPNLAQQKESNGEFPQYTSFLDTLVSSNHFLWIKEVP